jgi:hypothetical protein
MDKKSHKGYIIKKVHVQGHIDMPYGDMYIDDFIFSVNKDVYYLYNTGSEVIIEYEEHYNKLFKVTHHTLYSIKATGINKYDEIETWLTELPYSEEELVLLNRMSNPNKHYGLGIFSSCILSAFVFLIVKLVWKESIPNQYLFIGIGIVFLFFAILIAQMSHKKILQLIKKGKKKVIKMRVEEHSIGQNADRRGPARDYVKGTYGKENNEISILHQRYLSREKHSHLIFHLTMDDRLLAIYNTDQHELFRVKEL